MPYILEHNCKRNKDKYWVEKTVGEYSTTTKKENAKRYSIEKDAKRVRTQLKNKYGSDVSIDLSIIEVPPTLDEVSDNFDDAFKSDTDNGLIYIKDQDKYIGQAVQTSVETNKDEVIEALDYNTPTNEDIDIYFE